MHVDAQLALTLRHLFDFVGETMDVENTFHANSTLSHVIIY